MVKFLKVSGLFILAWLAMVLLINLFMVMTGEGVFDWRQIKEMLPVTGILCVFPAGIMLADYLRVNSSN